MLTMRSFEDVREVLRPLYKVYTKMSTDAIYTLDRMRALLEYLGNPQESLRVIHVAGTSGKTSTSYYVSALLAATGAKVGLTVSPHIVELNERVQINQTPLPEAEFCSAFGSFWERVQASKVEPSYFEVMVAFAFTQFAKAEVDYAVIEVGLGGLLDGTNVVDRVDKVCVITDIGFDHTHVLGRTLGEIAGQKAGIIQRRNHVFMYEQVPEVMQVVRSRCRQQDATLHVASDAGEGRGKLPAFQQRNFALAVQTVSYVLARDEHAPLTKEQFAQASAQHIPGRMEIFTIGNKTVVVDGAHNGQKMETFLSSVRQRFGEEPFDAVAAFAVARDDRWRHALDLLAKASANLTLTSFALEPDDMPKHSMDPFVAAEYLEQNGYHPKIEQNLQNAVQKLLESPQNVVVITGSLYLVSAAYPLLKQLGLR